MKKMKEIPSLLLATLALCACSSGGDEQPVSPELPTTSANPIPIRISTVMEEIGGKRATDYAFEVGDPVGVYVVNRKADGTANTLLSQGNWVDNMRFTYDGTWTPDTPVYWQDENTHADFYLYYPYTVTLTDVTAMPVSVSADQSTEAAYKAGDLLVGSTQDVAPTETAVSITARHAMSLMSIAVVPGNGFTEESLAAADVSVRINGVKTHATVNLATATVTATGEATSVTPLQEADGGYKALIVPQSVAQGNLVTVTVDGRDFNLQKAFTFEGGKRHRFTVVLNKTSNGINVTIDQWEDDGIDHGGTAE